MNSVNCEDLLRNQANTSSPWPWCRITATVINGGFFFSSLVGLAAHVIAEFSADFTLQQPRHAANTTSQEKSSNILIFKGEKE